MEESDARIGRSVVTSDVWWSLIVGFITLVGGVARSQPKLSGDQAVFISIFDAVAAGDRLYVDIFDHKDPVFFWLGGLEYRLFSIYGPFIAEVVLLAVFAVAVMWMGMYRSLPAWLAGAIGTGSAAFLVRSWFYDGLSTSVLGLTLVAVGAALTMGDRPAPPASYLQPCSLRKCHLPRCSCRSWWLAPFDTDDHRSFAA